MTLDRALALLSAQCSKREHCTSDLRRKLLRWELPEEEIEQALQFLLRHRFVDDARYARLYAEDKFRFNRWGKEKITLMLRRKGIPADLIADALHAIPADNYADQCLDLLRQKCRTLRKSDPRRLKARLLRFALSRGFDYDTALHALSLLPLEE